MYSGEILEGIRSKLENDGSADYITLNESLGVIVTIGEILIGLLTGLIILSIPLMIALEVMYINFPVVHERVDQLSIRSAGWEKTTGFVLRDAKAAVERANTIETGSSANWIYLKLKAGTLVLLGIAISLALGFGAEIIGFLWRVGRQMLSVLA